MTVINDLAYDSGDLLQWDNLQLKNSYSGQVVNDVRYRESGYAARFEVRQDDDPIGDGHERAELATTPAAINGVGDGGEIYVGWATLMPDLATLNPTIGVNQTNIFTQIHEAAPSQPVPPVRVTVDTSAVDPSGYYIKVLVAGQGFPSTPATTWNIGAPAYGSWTTFVFHIKFSPDPAVGFFEMWRDRVQVIPLTHLATKYTGQDCYLKQGFYRSNQSGTSVIYHDETKVADTYNDAKPPNRVPPTQGQVVRVPDGMGGFDQVYRQVV